MSLWRFLLYTTVGSLIWNSVFVFSGYALGENWHRDGSRLQGIAVQATPAAKVKAARALINAFWSRAAADGIDMDAALAAVVAERDAQKPQEEAPAPEVPAEPSEAGSDEHSPAPTTPEPAPRERVEVLAENLERSVEEAKAARAAAPVNQADVPTGDPAPPETEEERRERKAAARRLAADWADNVRAMAEGVPQPVADAIAAHVAGLHHSRVNDLVTEGGFADELGPGTHIDARRMGAVVTLLHAFKATGALPEGVSADG